MDIEDPDNYVYLCDNLCWQNLQQKVRYVQQLLDVAKFSDYDTLAK